MYDHLDRLTQTIGRPITRLKVPLTAEQYFYEYTARPSAKLVTDRGLSWPSHACRWCTGRLKTHVINRHLSQLRRKYQLERYVGIAADEAHRFRDLHYPLVEWGMTEVDCLQYCKKHGFDWGGLYDIFRRVSCWCCPLQPLSELRKLRIHCRICGGSSCTWMHIPGSPFAKITPPNNWTSDSNSKKNEQHMAYPLPGRLFCCAR